jgi:hypothetical protein
MLMMNNDTESCSSAGSHVEGACAVRLVKGGTRWRCRLAFELIGDSCHWEAHVCGCAGEV